MSTQPPNTPPWGPPPGQNPRDYARQQKEYWRALREQNREQWRAQREQWKAQRDQWRAGIPQRRSIVGPVVIIAVGLLALLIYAGKVSGERFWEWYGHWWPALLIVGGVALLVEWLIDRDEPYPRRHGGLGFLIFLVILTGIAASAFTHWGWRDNFNFNDEDTRRFFSGPEHDSIVTASAALPAGGSLQVRNGLRGDVNITASADNQVTVTMHRRVFGGSDSDASSRADALKPVVSTSGSVVTVTVDGTDRAAADLDIALPAAAAVDISSEHGDLSISGRTGNISFTGKHGDIRLSDNTGNAVLRNNGGDVQVQQQRGDVTLNGKFDDVSLSDIHGAVALNGDFNGDITMHQLNGQLHVHSANTDLSLSRVDGQFSLDGEDLHLSDAQGPLTLTTRNKQVQLDNISGDITVTNSNGSVNVTPANPLGNVKVDNHGEGISVNLPAVPGFTLNAEAHDGEVQNDFGLQNQHQGEDHNLTTGTVGDGRLRVTLATSGGDINVRKAGSVPTIPAAPAAPSAPPAPPAPKMTKIPRVPKAPGAPDVPAPPIVNQ